MLTVMANGVLQKGFQKLDCAQSDGPALALFKPFGSKAYFATITPQAIRAPAEPSGSLS